MSTTRPFPAVTTGEIEQILAGAARVAEEIRGRAEQERETLVAATRLRAAGIIKAARHRVTESGQRADERINAAEELRAGAEEERRSIVAAADSRAVEVVKEGENRTREIVDHAADVGRASDEFREQAEKERRSIIAMAEARRDEIGKEAEDRAHGIMGRTAGLVTLLGEQAETLRTQLLQMRATLESAVGAAASAMSEKAELEFEQEV